MTRGKLVLVCNDGILCSQEFNGDMMPNSCGGNAVKSLQKIKGKKTFEQEFTNFYKDYYGHEIEREVEEYYWQEEVLDFKRESYFSIWFSDYLYVKNAMRKPVYAVDYNGERFAIEPGQIVILRFGKRDKQGEKLLNI